MSSGVAWIDRKVGELRGAREHLTQLGLHPRQAGPGLGSGWRLPLWVGVFTDDMLIEMARERGVRPAFAEASAGKPTRGGGTT